MNEKVLEKIKETYLKYGKQKTYKHVADVMHVALKMAKRHDLDENKCILASLLHDISAIMSPDDMYLLANKRNMEIDKAEEKYHFLLHQRISKIIAKEIFFVEDKDILSAIECHTTLKKDANDYDKVVFLADKLAWDQEGIPSYYDELIKTIDVSLDKGCYYFIKYQFDNEQLLMPHHWIIEAYQQLNTKVAKM